MAVYTHASVASRTAGFIPGVTQIKTDAISISKSSSPFTLDTPSPPPLGVSDFDRLLQENLAASELPVSPSSLPPSQTAEQVTPSPAAPNQDDQTFTSESRTAGRAVKSEGDSPQGTTEKLSFWDVLDVINPLQHIPGISTIYQSLTGDKISPPARVLGGAVYGGPLGAAFGVANAVTEKVIGQDIGGSVLAFARSGQNNTAPNTSPEIELASLTLDFADDLISPHLTTQTTLSAQEITQQDIVWDAPRINTAPHATQISPSDTFTPQVTAVDNRSLGIHSSHQLPDDQIQNATPKTSIALKEEERNRKEIPYAGQEDLGSPRHSFSHAVQDVTAVGSATHSEPTASTSETLKTAQENNTNAFGPIPTDNLHKRMMDALDKYKAIQNPAKI